MKKAFALICQETRSGKPIFFIACLFLLWSSWPAWAITHQDLQEVSIGVLTIRPPEQTLVDWQPTANYLTRSIPGFRFKIEPLDIERLNGAVANNKLDFVLTNPAHYVYLEAKHRITRVATLVRTVDGQPLKEFGGVIFVRSDRNDVRDLNDIKGKKFQQRVSNGLVPTRLRPLSCFSSASMFGKMPIFHLPGSHRIRWFK